jgi:hypothetical protein
MQKYEDMAFETVMHAMTACKGDNPKPMRTYYYVAYAARNIPQYSMRDISRVTAEQWKQAKSIAYNCEHKEINNEQ